MGCSPRGREESDTTERLHFHFSLPCTGEGNGNPLQCSCLENPRDQGAWWAAVYGVAQNWTRLKRLSSSSSSKVRVWDRWSLGPLIVNIHESPKKQRTQTKSMFWFHFLSVLFHLSPLWRLYFNGVTRRYLLCICLYCVFAVYYLFVVTWPKELKEEVLERGRG